MSTETPTTLSRQQAIAQLRDVTHIGRFHESISPVVTEEARKLCNFFGFKPGKSWDMLTDNDQLHIVTDLLDEDLCDIYKHNLDQFQKTRHYLLDKYLETDKLEGYESGVYPEANREFIDAYRLADKAARATSIPGR